MQRMITCISVGVYRHAFTRGQRYILLDHDPEKAQVKVRGDNTRTRWYPSAYFDFDNGPAPVLVAWHFEDPVRDELSGWDETKNWVTVWMELSDGTQRWCYFTTPDYLKSLLESRNDPKGGYEPAIYSQNLIIVCDLYEKTVDWTLRYIDQQGELTKYTGLIDPTETAGDFIEDDLEEETKESLSSLFGDLFREEMPGGE